MTPSEEHHLTPGAWLETLERDYLRQYIPDGGAAVKIAVASERDRETVRAQLSAVAEARRFRHAHVDSGDHRVHLVQHLFSAIARQLPWNEIAANVMRRALADKNFRLPPSGSLSLEDLAEANNMTIAELNPDLRSLVSNYVYRNYGLSREFRAAARRLCNAVYDASTDTQLQAADVRQWFTGELERISRLRDIGIYRKIGRHNARQLLYSTSAWLPTGGEPGLIVTVDVARYVLGKEASRGAVPPYTKLAALDLNEVLRQFIDATDELRSTLLVFLTDERFLPGEERGLQSFPALELRLTDDVRDRRRPNPLAPMVRLRSAA